MNDNRQQTTLPDFCYCPISNEIMYDPVIVDGRVCKCTVSRSAFEEWVSTREHNTCPICGAQLLSTNKFPNSLLADAIKATIDDLQHNRPARLANNRQMDS